MVYQFGRCEHCVRGRLAQTDTLPDRRLSAHLRRVRLQNDVKPSTIRALTELEKEMAWARRVAAAEALREALAVLARAAWGWLGNGQAAERLDVTVPPVKDWIRRGTLEGQPVGSRWRVSAASVDKVLRVRGMLAEMEDEGYPTEEEIRELIRRVRRQMAAETKPSDARGPSCR